MIKKAKLLIGLFLLTLNFLFNANLAFAQTNTTTTAATSSADTTGRVDQTIRDLLCAPSANSALGSGSNSSQDLYICINKFYRFSVALVSIGAVFMITVAGYLYIGSDGSEEQVSKAKEILVSSIASIIILFISFIFLREINPDLVAFRIIQPISVTGTPGSFTSDGLPRTSGSFTIRACGREFKSPSDASGQITSLSVQVWDLSGGGKTSTTKTVQVHNCISNRVKTAFQNIYNDPEKFPIHGSIGSYNVRFVAGTRAISAHALGLAMDINSNENAQIKNGQITAGSLYKPCPGTNCNPYSIPASGSLVRSFKAQGFGWGGDWNSSKDYMHVSCAENEHASCN